MLSQSIVAVGVIAFFFCNVVFVDASVIVGVFIVASVIVVYNLEVSHHTTSRSKHSK